MRSLCTRDKVWHLHHLIIGEKPLYLDHFHLPLGHHHSHHRPQLNRIHALYLGAFLVSHQVPQICPHLQPHHFETLVHYGLLVLNFDPCLNIASQHKSVFFLQNQGIEIIITNQSNLPSIRNIVKQLPCNDRNKSRDIQNIVKRNHTVIYKNQILSYDKTHKRLQGHFFGY